MAAGHGLSPHGPTIQATWTEPGPGVKSMAGHDLQQDAIGTVDQDAQNVLHPQGGKLHQH